MTIMRGDRDVTAEVHARAEELRVGAHGQAQRAELVRILDGALYAIHHRISVPWLDDCIDETRLDLIRLRDAIEHKAGK